jgi:hypothetical protein
VFLFYHKPKKALVTLDLRKKNPSLPGIVGFSLEACFTVVWILAWAAHIYEAAKERSSQHFQTDRFKRLFTQSLSKVPKKKSRFG